MLDTLVHRGPDGWGVKSLLAGRVLLGHRRLAIIDLSPAAAQPLANEDESIWLTFNGEIYNYRQLRDQLLACGHRFRSQSDSEVIVHAYEEWGDDCVHHLRGIFAFGLWDGRKERLLLVRDPLGVKPLYYGRDGTRFAFASQPKAIISAPNWPREANATAFRDYLAFGYVPYDRCAFSGLHKLPAGHLAVMSEGNLSVRSYWTPAPAELNGGDPLENVESLLQKAVRSQLVSDVPVGCFLSGGIDSSLLVALAATQHKDLRTFTVGFDDQVSDERPYARIVAKHFGTQHAESQLNRLAIETRLMALQEFFDEPFDPNGSLPFMEVAALARRQNTVVALGGDGADELFIGYLRYEDFDRPAALLGRNTDPFVKLWQNLRRHGIWPPRKMNAGDLRRFFPYEGCLTDASGLLTQSFLGCADGSPLDLLRNFSIPDASAISGAQMLDIRLYLVDHILCKVDRASMAHGVEARVPYLDTELVRAALALPLNVNYQRCERKALLKSIARRHLPTAVVTQRKKGFSSPLGQWIDAKFLRWADALLDDGALIRLGILRPDWRNEINRLAVLNHPGPLRPRWLLVNAELWARRWLVPDMWPEYNDV